jgi:pimeloyl-ACP methyl ester carboxylesterase
MDDMAQERLKSVAIDPEGFLEVEPGWFVHYKLTRAKTTAAETPVAVFLNGLGDEQTSWSPFVSGLTNIDRLQLDLRGQGLSLKRRLEHDPNTKFRISIPTQSQDIDAVLDHLNVRKQVYIVGNSYGGGVAFEFASRYPERVKRLALIVPYILRLDRTFPLQRLWSWQWRTAKSFGFIPSSIASGVESAYESFLSAYMNQRFQNRMTESRNRQVAIDLSHGIMEFDAFDVLEKLPDQSVFLLTSDCDTLIPRSLFKEFWRRLPESKQGHWTRVHDGEHLLLEQKPELVLQWLRSVIT